MATTKNPVHLLYQLITTGTILAIIIYQRTVSPLFPLKCRFEPSCSHYMIDVIREWGLLKGGWLGIKRIGKCHPFGGWGYDPVPRKRKPDTID